MLLRVGYRTRWDRTEAELGGFVGESSIGDRGRSPRSHRGDTDLVNGDRHPRNRRGSAVGRDVSTGWRFCIWLRSRAAACSNEEGEDRDSSDPQFAQ